MKIDKLAHRIAGEALALLEQKYHYRIAEGHKTDIQEAVVSHLKQLVPEKGGPKPKIDELVHGIAGDALSLLERTYHYRMAEDHKKDVQNTIVKNLNQYLAEPAEPAEE